MSEQTSDDLRFLLQYLAIALFALTVYGVGTVIQAWGDDWWDVAFRALGTVAIADATRSAFVRSTKYPRNPARIKAHAGEEEA